MSNDQRPATVHDQEKETVPQTVLETVPQTVSLPADLSLATGQTEQSQEIVSRHESLQLSPSQLEELIASTLSRPAFGKILRDLVESESRKTMSPSPSSSSSGSFTGSSPNHRVPPAAFLPTLRNADAWVKPELDNEGKTSQESLYGTPAPKKKLKAKIADFLQRYYHVTTDTPELVLPKPPTDTEKLSYLGMHRWTYGLIGCLGVGGVCAGFWLFAFTKHAFYWFIPIAAWITLYGFATYLPGFFASPFDFVDHERTLLDYAITEDAAKEPLVDVYLPCCGEPLEVLANTYWYVAQLQYCRGRLEVYVLDDGSSDEVRELANRYGFNYIRREGNHMKKAGNLRHAFALTKGDFFLILDADFCPRPDFLLTTIPHMKRDRRIAVLQTPQYFKQHENNTWTEKGAGAVQEGFYRYVQVARNHWGAAICVGTNAVYSRHCLAEVGGTAEIAHSEDVHTGFEALDRGWKVDYMPIVLAAGMSPDTPRALFSQHLRWCTGSTTLFFNKKLWTSRSMTVVQKVTYLSGLMYYTVMALSIFAVPLPGVLTVWFAPVYVKWWNLFFVFPALAFILINSRVWSSQKRDFSPQQVSLVLQYAYLCALLDRVFGQVAQWAATGDSKAHRSARFRNMRWLALVWTISWVAALAVGSVFRILEGWNWYDFAPFLLLAAYYCFLQGPFVLSR